MREYRSCRSMFLLLKIYPVTASACHTPLPSTKREVHVLGCQDHLVRSRECSGRLANTAVIPFHSVSILRRPLQQ